MLWEHRGESNQRNVLPEVFSELDLEKWDGLDIIVLIRTQGEPIGGFCLDGSKVTRCGNKARMREEKLRHGRHRKLG